MKVRESSTLLVFFLWVYLAGCGGNSTSINPPVTAACTGIVISGTLHDSLTSQPVSQGWAVLESGTELSITADYFFYPTQTVATDAQGGFSLCAQSLTSPSALVLEAMDSAGNAYPPYVAPISGTASLGTIPMGGCTLTCGLFQGQQQTSTPATVTGLITSSPVAATGTVVPQYVMVALDGSKSATGSPNLWALAMPIFNASPTLTFSTTSNACAAGVPFCSTYTFKVPSQSPISSVSGGSIQATVSPIYLIYAVPGITAPCSPPSGLSVLQQDGKSFLTATPGAQLTAADINFANCH